jgi:superfamily II DNA or RNA helicase
MRIAARFTGELDDNQQIVHDWLMEMRFNHDRIASGTAAALLNLRAGLGKTFIAAALIASLGLRTLYVVLRDNLRVQAIDDLRSVLADCRIDAYGMRSGPNDVDVIIVNSAVGLSADAMKNYGMVIYDEVHAYASAKRSTIFRRTMTWVNLGMSATTDERGDGLDGVYAKELALGGETIAAELPGFDAADVMFNIDVDIVHYWGPREYTETLTHPSTGTVFTPWMQKQLMADRCRTRLIAQYLAELYMETDDDGQPVHGIYVFAEERDHLDMIFGDLQTMFAERGWELYAPEIGKYVGGTKRADIRRITETCRVYLTTYGYSSAGVSVNSMTAIILATPRKAGMTQVVGRICRRNGNPLIRRRIVDIVDAGTIFRRQAHVREEAYMARGGDDGGWVNITHRRVDWESIELPADTNMDPPADTEIDTDATRAARM